MSIPSPGAVPGAFPGGFPNGAPARNRLVGLGLALVVLGWLALVADLVLAAVQLQPGGLVAVLSLKGDIATLSEMLIVTGLGLAILGGLREGFGALNRFFDAVLQRSTAGRPAPGAVHGSAHGAMQGTMQGTMQGSTNGTGAPQPPSVELDDEVAPPRREAPERPAVPMAMQASAPAPGRNYQILPDGSVEVETLLGTRVFASMEEARDFIR